MDDHAVPANVEAERAVLGAALFGPAVVDAVVQGLSSASFLLPRHRVVFEAIEALHREGVGVDELTLVAKLTNSGQLEAAGGAPYVVDLERFVRSTAGIAGYIDEVRAQFVRRSVHAAGAEAMRAAVTGEDAELVLATAERSLLGVRDALQGNASDRHGMAEAMPEWWDNRIDPLQQGSGMDWPWSPITDAVGPSRPGDVVVVSGPTKDGKTWIALDLVEEWLQHGRVGLWSLEMRRSEVIERHVAMGGFDLMALQRRKLSPSVIRDRVEAIKGWSYDVFDDSFVSVDDIAAELARARALGRPYRTVVLDNLNLLQLPGRDPYNALNQALLRIKALAGRFGVTFVVLCQLKKSDDDWSEPPRFPDIRDSSAIPNIATVVLMLWRLRDENGRRQDEAKLGVLLTRNGILPSPLSVWWNRHDRMRFRAHEWRPDAPPSPEQVSFEDVYIP